jgi:hypothetical protein
VAGRLVQLADLRAPPDQITAAIGSHEEEITGPKERGIGEIVRCPDPLEAGGRQTPSRAYVRDANDRKSLTAVCRGVAEAVAKLHQVAEATL